jgi:hypothetical protein
MYNFALVLAALLLFVPPAMSQPNKNSPALEISNKVSIFGLPGGIQVKPRVILRGLNKKMFPVFLKAPDIWRKYGKNLVITSGLEGKHCKDSRHFVGMALDLRSLNLDRNARTQVRNELAGALGREYRIFMENDHIHVEYNPPQSFGLLKTLSYPGLTFIQGDRAELAKETP